MFSHDAFYFEDLAFLYHYVLSLRPDLILPNVRFNPIIPDSLSYAHVSSWAEAGLFHLRQLVHPVTRRFHAFKDLQTTYHIPRHKFFFYLQIKHY